MPEPAKKPIARKAKSEPGVFDVARPSKVTANTSARPVIVGHRPMVQDPMVKDGKDAAPAKAAKKVTVSEPADKPLTSKKELVLKPTDQKTLDEDSVAPTPGDTISASEEAPVLEDVPAESIDNIEDLPVDSKQEVANKEAAPKPETPADRPEEASAAEADVPSGDTVENPLISESEETPANTEDTSTESTNQPAAEADESQEGGLVDELAKQAAEKKQQKEQDKVMAAQQEKMNALIENKTYFVPTSRLTRRTKMRTLFVLFLLLIFAAAGFLFALDAELIDVGIKPLTNFIPN